MKAIEFNADGAKNCPQCKLSLSVDCFGKDVNTPTGLKVWCRGCIQTKSVEYRSRQYVKDKSIWSSMKYRYAMGREDYEHMFAEQNGCCAICGEPETCLNSDGVTIKRLSIDHDHKCCSGERASCGKCIRGLLCANCNRGIGYLKDDPNLLLTAAAYVMANQDVLIGGELNCH